jgi:hypothetical protein
MARTMAAAQTGKPRCANCGVDIPWRPRIHRGRTYCCGGCAQGGPCYCSYDLATISGRLRTRTRPPRRAPRHRPGRAPGESER